jgi:hypothetical protein
VVSVDDNLNKRRNHELAYRLNQAFGIPAKEEVTARLESQQRVKTNPSVQ